MVYRADIDGLRAIAVLSVVLFHLSPTLLPGGFVGVDVFFVISGYLITGNIVQQLRAGRFSLLEFYRRRVKRIAPAMLVVTATVLVAAWLWMLPEQMRDTGKSAVFSLASLANVYFWRYQDTGYFAQSSLELPLLHLWSLGVEEQFYLLWPLLLAAFYRRVRPAGFALGMLLLATASFWMGSAFFDSAPSFVYYMLPARAGELLLGALVAVLVNEGLTRRVPDGVMPWLALAGLTALAGSLTLLDENHVFPGWNAVPPTLGTAMLLLAGQRRGNFISNLLALPPLVGVGLISYSAYLWHWPVLAFYRYGYGAIGWAPGLVLLAAIFVLAWLSFQFVEQPARHAGGSAWRVFTVQLIVPGALLAGAALLLVYAERMGLNLASPAYQARLDGIRAATQPAFLADQVCQFQSISKPEMTLERCVGGAPAPAHVEAMLWGDSNAAHYQAMIDVLAERAGFRFRNLELGSCPPLLRNVTPFVEPRRALDCAQASDIVRDGIDAYPVVILAGLWNGYMERSADFLPALFATIEELARNHRLVVVLGKAPTLTGYDRNCREKALKIPWRTCPTVIAPDMTEISAVNQQLRSFVATVDNVRYFDANEFLCPAGRCALNDAAGAPRYFDLLHLSQQGARDVGRLILREQGVPAVFSEIAAGAAAPSHDDRQRLGAR